MMTKLKLFLWVVAVAYIVYAIVTTGPTTTLIAILAAAIFVGIMQVWLHSDARKKLTKKYDNRK